MGELATKEDANRYTESPLTPIEEYVTKQEYLNAGGTLRNESTYANNEFVQISDLYDTVVYQWTMTMNTSNVPTGRDQEIHVRGNVAGAAGGSRPVYKLQGAGYTGNQNYISYEYNGGYYRCLMGNNLSGTLTFYMETSFGEVILRQMAMNQFSNNKNIPLGQNVRRYCIANNLTTTPSVNWKMGGLYIFEDKGAIANNRSWLGTNEEVENKFRGLGYSRGKSYAYDAPYVSVIKGWNTDEPYLENIRVGIDQVLWSYYLYYNVNTSRYEWVEAYQQTGEAGMDRNKYYGDQGAYYYNIDSDVYGTYTDPIAENDGRCRQADEWIEPYNSK